MADSSKKKKGGRSEPVARGTQVYTVGASKSPPKKSGGSGGGRSPVLIGGIALVVVAAVAIAIGFISMAGGGDDGATASAADFDAAVKTADCTVKEFPIDKGGEHIAATDPDPASWDSDPPTHGPHDPVWSIWGQYDSEVAQRNLVHNLEHAGLVIQYGPKVPEAQLAALKTAVLKDTEWTVLAPYAKLNDTIAFEVWGKLTECKKFDQTVLDRFRSYRNKPGGSAESDQFPDGRDWSQEQRQPGW
jgi:hypothetical protein